MFQRALARTETGKVNVGTAVAGRFANTGVVAGSAQHAVAAAFASTESARVGASGVMGSAYVSIADSRADVSYAMGCISEPIQFVFMALKKRIAKAARNQICGLALRC